MKIRDSDARDTAAIQSLYDAFYPAPAPDVRKLAETYRFRVGENDIGEVAGIMSLSPTGFVWVAVCESDRQQGIGRALMNEALALGIERAAAELTSRVSDTDAAGLAFCAAFDFQPYLHMVNLDLDLQAWDESEFVALLERATATGLAFKTYAECGDSAAHRERLYTLNKTLSATIPRDQPQPFIDFERYVNDRLLPDTFPHEGIFLAVDGDDWIGMSQVSLPARDAFSQMTGVLPAYRGRGIGQALKLLSIRFAKQNGQRSLKTFNDATNAPMIAVNEKLGFRQRGRFYQVRRKLGAES